MSQISKVEVAGTTYDIAGSVNISTTDSNKYNLIGTLENASGTTDTVYVSPYYLAFDPVTNGGSLEIGKATTGEEISGLPQLRFLGSTENPDNEIGHADVRITPTDPNGSDYTSTLSLPDSSGVLAVGPTGGVGSASTPVYMNSGGRLVACTDISSEDKKVQQDEITSSTSAVLLTAAGSQTGTTTSTSRYSNYIWIQQTGNTTAAHGVVKTKGFNAGAGYYVFGSDTTDAKAYAQLKSGTIGTTSTIGDGRVILGNGTASGTDGNAKGLITIYATGTGYNNIHGRSANANSSYANYMPSAGGQLAVGTSDAATGSGITPVYMASTGLITACSYSLIPYTTVTSW